MERRGVPARLATPLWWRALVRLGVPVAPPLFWGLPALLALHVLGSATVLFCLFCSMDLVAEQYIAGYRYFGEGHAWAYWLLPLFFGVTMSPWALLYRRKARSVDLPAWGAYA